jgi:hypothetical protein
VNIFKKGDRVKINYNNVTITKAGANEEWLYAASKALLEVSRKKKTFTTDDIWEQIPASITTPEPRALGALMLEASKQGIIKTTGRVKKSKRRECHNRPLQIWKSLNYANA